MMVLPLGVEVGMGKVGGVAGCGVLARGAGHSMVMKLVCPSQGVERGGRQERRLLGKSSGRFSPRCGAHF